MNQPPRTTAPTRRTAPTRHARAAPPRALPHPLLLLPLPRGAAQALAALGVAAALTGSALADPGPGGTLERWRSYQGVTWAAASTASPAAAPAPFANSVNTPIAGLHIDRQGRVFVSTPRLIAADSPATLSLLDTRHDSGPARLTAFPSEAGNAVAADPATRLRNVLGFHVDHRNGWLWALDMGFVAGEAEAPAGGQKVVIYELATGRVVRRIALDGVADRRGSFLNDLAVDEVRRVAYVSDSGLRSAPQNLAGVVVLDFATGQARRVLHRHPALLPQPGVAVTAQGEAVWPGNPLVLGINGIALSPDGETLYWAVTTGLQAYRVPAALLREALAQAPGDGREAAGREATHWEAALANAVQPLEDPERVLGNTDGIVTDARGRLYLTDVTRNGIVRYDPQARRMQPLASDPRVAWPDTADITADGFLVFTASQLNRHFAGAVKPGLERYDLWRLKLEGLPAPAAAPR